MFLVTNSKNISADEDQGYILNNLDSFKVVPTSKKREIEKFSRWFHQDWALVFNNFTEGADLYLVNVSTEEKKELKKELKEFVKRNANLSPKSMMIAWIQLGAEGWDKNFPLWSTLNDFSDEL